jgi:hypothetical protein
MYARVARFEGADAEGLDRQVDEIRRQLQAGKQGQLPDDAPEGARTLMDTVARFVQLVDREQGVLVGITFCETEDEMRRANEALNAMSPGTGAGARASVETFEVAIDESFR